MNKEKLSPTQDLNVIKLVRGQLGKYGWEIKLVGEEEVEIVKRLKKVDTELNNTYNINKQEVK